MRLCCFRATVPTNRTFARGRARRGLSLFRPRRPSPVAHAVYWIGILILDSHQGHGDLADDALLPAVSSGDMNALRLRRLPTGHTPATLHALVLVTFDGVGVSPPRSPFAHDCHPEIDQEL